MTVLHGFARRRAWVLLFLVIGVAGFAAPADKTQADKARTPESALEFMYGMPAGLDLTALVGKPRILGITHYLFDDPVSGERRLGGYAEVAAVYDGPLDELLAVVLDFESTPEYAPRILGTEIRNRDGRVYDIYYNTGIRFLGMEIAFESIYRTGFEYLDGGAFGLRSHLVDSMDDLAYEHFISYYFKPVTVDGKQMTFIRYFNRPGLKRPSFGMLQVLDIFTPSEIRAQVAALVKEAARRSKGS